MPMEVSGKKAMTGLEATTAKLEATVKTEHGGGPEHGRRLGRWFTVAWRLIVVDCDEEEDRGWP